MPEPKLMEWIEDKALTLAGFGDEYVRDRNLLRYAMRQLAIEIARRLDERGYQIGIMRSLKATHSAAALREASAELMQELLPRLLPVRAISRGSTSGSGRDAICTVSGTIASDRSGNGNDVMAALDKACPRHQHALLFATADGGELGPHRFAE